jgi:hypothetical protein
MSIPRISLPFAVLAALASGSALSSQTLVGRVVDANGLGVPGVDIDVLNNASGGDPSLSQDFTNATGDFTTTVLGAGVYDITFAPPRPPVTTHLKVRLANRVVVGTVDLGTIVLPRGVSLGGRVVNEAGLPLAGVDLDVRDLTTGASVDLVGDSTSATGSFLFAVPPRSLELQVDPRGVPLVVLAPEAVELAPATNTDLGTIVLETGFRVSGLLSSNGIPVSGADLDVTRRLTGVELFLQGDTSSATGAFSFVVPNGTFEFRVCPKPGDPVVAHAFRPGRISADTALGVVALESGVTLSGTVRDRAGAPASGVDVEVTRTGGAPVALCRDDTNATGHYSVVVPLGVHDVRFRHPTLGNCFAGAVSVGGPTVLDGRVAPTEALVRNGAGVNPVVFTSLTPPVLGSTWSSAVDCAGHASDRALLVVKANGIQGPIRADGQVLIGGLEYVRLSRLHTGGVVQFDLPIQADPTLCGFVVHAQAIVRGGFRQRTNALDLTLGF